jgi:DNA ligase (NAD+)
VASFFGDERNRAVLEKLIARGVNPREPERKSEGPLGGRSFAVTGTLSRSRGEIKKAIEAAGGRFVTSVGKGTDYLVVGADVGEAKLAAARKHGTRVIGEVELEGMMVGSRPT